MNQCRNILRNWYCYCSYKDRVSFVIYLFLDILTTFLVSHVSAQTPNARKGDSSETASQEIRVSPKNDKLRHVPRTCIGLVISK